MQTSTAAAQRRRSTFSLRKIFPAMALVTSVSEADAGATRLRLQVIQREEQREKRQGQKKHSGKKQRAGEHRADRAFHSRSERESRPGRRSTSWPPRSALHRWWSRERRRQSWPQRPGLAGAGQEEGSVIAAAPLPVLIGQRGVSAAWVVR